MTRIVEDRHLGEPWFLWKVGNLTAIDSERVGSCDNSRQLITIDTNQSLIEEADTVLHEVLHATCYTMKLSLGQEVEERVVSALATGIVGVLQDNPQFAQWLIENKSAHLETA